MLQSLLIAYWLEACKPWAAWYSWGSFYEKPRPTTSEAAMRK